MTKDDDDTMCYRSELESAVKAEREACAKVCEDLPVFGSYRGLQTATLEDAAAAIRTRGEK